MDAATRKRYAAMIQPARKGKRWTQGDLAERAHVSVGLVSNAERGINVPGEGHLLSMLEALGVAVEGEDAPSSRCRCDQWSGDTRVALDVMGLYLESLSDEDRDTEIRNWTKEILGRNSQK